MESTEPLWSSRLWAQLGSSHQEVDLAQAPKGLHTPEEPVRGDILLPPGKILHVSWEGPPNMLGTISPNGVGRVRSCRVWPEISRGCSKHAQLSSTGCRPDAQLQWRPTSGAPGGSSAEGGQGHSSGHLTIMTSKCRRPESY